ncbi:FAD/NAD(P)-binding domain-containing protein [Obba rivulosa]|uniref:FAD/NAD(P)-binding domain-containing protein n=1 Tax=Obba rivulosa TaxID=1052685 RepID=A0A8E2AV14_9APHY|nr:FAD/NAD(P)-binding domain-containing protein [Obba rivulosa]
MDGWINYKERCELLGSWTQSILIHTMAPRIRIAVIGAGIGGLVFAVALHKLSQNVEVDVYESAAQFTEIGAGIGISGRVWEILQWLDLAEGLRPYAHIFGLPIRYRKADQAEGIDISTTLSNSFITFRRTDVQGVLCKNLPPSVRVHFLKRFTSYTRLDTGAIKIHYTDGTTATCDCLVGCDGIRSTVRTTMLNTLAIDMQQAGQQEEAAMLLSRANPIWTGTLLYRSLVPWAAFAREFPGHRALTDSMLYMGKNKHLIVYPVGNGDEAKLNVGAAIGNPHLEGTKYGGPWVAPAAKDEILEQFSHFEPAVKAIIERMEDISLWALHVAPPLPTHVHDRVALVGDAAHAMTPFQGAGAGQAIEDAYILASMLAHPMVTLETLPLALQVYDEIRRPFAQDIQKKSRESGLLIQFNTPDFAKYTVNESAAGGIGADVVEEIGKRQRELSEWSDNTSLIDDVERAKGLLDERMASFVNV